MKPPLFVLDTCTEHSAVFLINILRILEEQFQVDGCYCWIYQKDDLERLKGYSFQRFSPEEFASGRLESQIRSIRPAFVLCWNKHYPLYRQPLSYIQKELSQCRIIYTEAGWFPQREYVYFDPQGINGDSSIAALTSHDLMRSRIDNEFIFQL